MNESYAPLTMIDESAMTAAELRHDPYDFAFVEQAVPLRPKPETLADVPIIPDRGSYGLPDLVRGARFEAVINYVRPTWRDRDQLAFPDAPIGLGD